MNTDSRHNRSTRRHSVSTVRQSVRRELADYRWYILAGAAVVAFVLGCIGWARYLPQRYGGNHVGFSDAVYWSVKDFTMNSPDQPGLPWELDIARFLAPMVAGWGVLTALALLYRDRVQQMKIPLMRGHVVICGLGAYVGTVFLRNLQEKRIRAVAIELNANNPNIELCRSIGVPVIVGDAQRQRIQQAAGTHRASRVLAVTSDDAVNTQIVATARQLPGRRSRRLGCLARISDPEFCVLLRIQEAHRGDPELSVDFFNTDEISARLMLEDFPIDTQCGRPHIVVAHLDPLGVWLVYHAARTWNDNRGDSTVPLVVTVVDDKAKDRVEELIGQHPALEAVCTFIPFSANAKDIGRLPAHHSDAATPPIGRAYVTAYADEQAFQTGLRLRHELDAAIPITVALSRPHGVAGLLDDVKGAGTLVNIDVFSTMERTCTTELVRGGSFELMAHAIHERWRKEQLATGQPAPSWEDLDEARKESSREQARDIPVKLRMTGCAIAPLRDWDAKDFTFTDDEVRKLAIAEHDRWTRERIADGWTPIAGEPDIERKKTPFLVPWEELPPDIAEYDAMFVRAIPTILASAGLQVIRTQTAAAGESRP